MGRGLVLSALVAAWTTSRAASVRSRVSCVAALGAISSILAPLDMATGRTVSARVRARCGLEHVAGARDRAIGPVRRSIDRRR